ncbi:TerD family protein [Streptomyces sp. NPDC057854]|uniref:TerD family protein n=1 Tax=unclassified Streptomyces TaxID=2593676 RepID=UPI0036A81DB0
MTQIIKGGHLPIPGQVWKVAVVRGTSGGTSAAEPAVLLLDAAGRVRDDGDVVFRDRRAHASGAVRLIGQVPSGERRVADWLEIDTARVEPGVQRIVIAVAGDAETSGHVPRLLVRTINAVTGEELALYEVGDVTTETTFVLGEYYRRDGAWRFRAVGQGYDSGLAGLAEDYGITGEVPPRRPGAVPYASRAWPRSRRPRSLSHCPSGTSSRRPRLPHPPGARTRHRSHPPRHPNRPPPHNLRP